ncbi:hypothetical protein BU26DRAFT_516043, partial [Trematosphaeria pertusa]
MNCITGWAPVPLESRDRPLRTNPLPRPSTCKSSLLTPVATAPKSKSTRYPRRVELLYAGDLRVWQAGRGRS